MKTRFIILALAGTAIAGIASAIVFSYESQSPAFPFGYPRVSQNDMYCTTVWVAKYQEPVIVEDLKEIIKNKISEFGPDYDIPDRRVSVEIIDEDTMRIKVAGLWDEAPNTEEPYLTSFIKQLGFQLEDIVAAICA